VRGIVAFVSVGAVGAKTVAFLFQYTVFRTLVRRNLKRSQAAFSAGVAVVR
jgi:hypothetical protein